MTKAGPRPRPGRTGPDSKPPQGSAAGEAFPPLTTSLEGFVKDGSDREFRRLIYTLVSLTNQMARHRKLFAAYLGVTEAQAIMMRIIAEGPDATVGYLAQQLYVTSQFVTIEIGTLVRKNIVEKRPNEADRRSMFLSLTPKGRNLLRELAPVMRMANDVHFGSLTRERARALQEIVGTIVRDGVTAYHDLIAPHMRGKMAPSAQPNPMRRKSTGHRRKSAPGP
jgi:DNA-binding MarR family transcriptional regulator